MQSNMHHMFCLFYIALGATQDDFFPFLSISCSQQIKTAGCTRPLQKKSIKREEKNMDNIQFDNPIS